MSEKSYRQIMKATSIFGGMQVLNIIIGLIRSKAVAYLIGPEGIGIRGLLESSIRLITQTTSFGLLTSGVKFISEAIGKNPQKIDVIAKIIKILAWITGAIGIVVVCSLSAWLSKISFGNYDYTFSFVLLSIILLFDQLTDGEKVLLQGTRKIKHLAQSTVYGAATSLLVTIPVYFFFKLQGIVPNLIINSLSTLLFTWYFSRKIKVKSIQIDKQEKIHYSKGILSLGLSTSLSNIFSLGSMYLIQAYIRNKGGIEEVGLFVAGWVIVNTYVGMVFKAMATDYLPRLASVNSNRKKFTETINQQLEIALFIITPIIVLFIIYIPFIINILYTSEFLQIQGLMKWAMLGMIFRTASWSIGFSIAAKGDAKALILNSIISATYMFGLNILGYHIWGLDGLGISFLVGYMIHTLQMYSFAHFKYKFRFIPQIIPVFLVAFTFSTLCFLITTSFNSFYSSLYGSIVILITALLSYKQLDNRIGINKTIRKHIKKK